MDEASKFLEDITVSQPQLPAAYRKLTLDSPIVDGTINLSISSISMVDHVVNLVTSLAEPVDKVVDPIPSSVDPTLPLESATQVVDLIPSSIDTTLPLESGTQADDVFPPVDPILPPYPLPLSRPSTCVPSRVCFFRQMKIFWKP
jgi:hypothetical protein